MEASSAQHIQGVCAMSDGVRATSVVLALRGLLGLLTCSLVTRYCGYPLVCRVLGLRAAGMLWRFRRCVCVG